MKRIALFALVLSSLAAAPAARAGHVLETLSLSNGWNAVYLESTPTNAVLEDFFAETPQVETVSCYMPSVYAATDQIGPDGTAVDQAPAAFLVWERGKASDSTLRRLAGGRCYLVYATSPAELTFHGVPCVPQATWQKAEDGFATVAGVSAAPTDTVSSIVYFREGPLERSSAETPYAVAGTDATAPEYRRIVTFGGKSPTLRGGRAYAFEGSRPASWAGVVEVSVPSMDGVVTFAPGTAHRMITVANAGTTNRTLRVAYGASELEGETQPPLQIYIPRNGTNEEGWAEFATHDFELDPGESVMLTLAVDKARLDPAATNAALVTVSDLSGTKMRVRVPVRVEADEDTPLAAAFPKGLWAGHVTLSQVDHLGDGAPIPAGGKMRATMLIHVDSDGAAHLLQRVAVGTAEEAAEDGSHEVRLWADPTNAPSGWSARRISAVFPDLAHRSLDANGGGSFGDAVSFDWVVAADARDNPFRHAWHPDHGSGYDVTNHLALSWWTEAEESTWEYNPDETTYGIATWTLGGLSGAGDVKMRGVFALQRVLAISEIEE